MIFCYSYYHVFNLTGTLYIIKDVKLTLIEILLQIFQCLSKMHLIIEVVVGGRQLKLPI